MPHSHIQTLPQRSRPGLFARALAFFSTATTRSRDRQRLAHLDAYLLRDIGLDAQEVRRECAKPFWQP